MRSNDLGQHGAHTQQQSALGSPIPAGAGAVFLASQDHQRHAFLAVLHGSIVDTHLFAIRQMERHAAFDPRQQAVLQADIGEGAAGHDPVVAAPRAVRVEIPGRDAVLDQIFPCRAVRGEGARRGDMVGGDRVAQNCQGARPLDAWISGTSRCKSAKKGGSWM